jgi:hypothetical protein
MSLVLKVKLLLWSWKNINRQVPFKILWTCFKHAIKHYVLRSINSLILFGIRKNCLSSERNLLLQQFTSSQIKLPVVIIKEYHCHQLHKILSNIFPRLSPHIDEINGDHQCGFNATDQLLIRFLHLSVTADKMGVQWDSTSAIHRLQQSL